MDIRIKKNEKCTIGLPSCDFVFSSTRYCFIAYGFDTSKDEKDTLCELLEKRNIEPIEAGSIIAPAQNVYCTKICSKIIISRFCIALLNNDIKNDQEVPNANVHMEYGLMLGFNKYIIPFQKKSQSLAFNISGLDTMKYRDIKFRDVAKNAIDKAIKDTEQSTHTSAGLNNAITQAFLLSKKAMFAPLDDMGDKNIFNLGNQLGFNLLNDFTGLKYIFLGNFTTLRSEVILWRLKTLTEILKGRTASIPSRVEKGLMKAEHQKTVRSLFNSTNIWLIITSQKDKEIIIREAKNMKIENGLKVYAIKDVEEEIQKITTIKS